MTCPYTYRCKSYPHKCFGCIHNNEEDHFAPKRPYYQPFRGFVPMRQQMIFEGVTDLRT